MTKYFTREGLEVKQRQVAAQEQKVREVGKEAGAEAGVNCDWHDNFGYEDAKRRLEMESTLLAQMREDLNGAQIVIAEEQNVRVSIGVTVVAVINSDEKTITIGGFGESDPPNGLIAYSSPLGRALVGMGVGDTKKAHIGGKAVDIEVFDIHPPSHCYRNLLLSWIERQATPEGTRPRQG
jgi:transcription elongation factor GreA